MIDIIDPALAAQNDSGAMAVLNELALVMTMVRKASPRFSKLAN